jgi:hypothetical protein
MSTHATLGIKFPDGKINGCYVHYDGATMETRINNYLDKYTTTCLSLTIIRAQATGGIRSFHSPGLDEGAPETDFLDDNEPYVIDEHNWRFDHMGANYQYLIDYETGEVHVSSKY